MDGQRVLIVEDDPATRHALVHGFSRREWKAIGAETIAEALRLFDTQPDWIILDLGLPDGDGREILEQVRLRELRTKVAVCSGLVDPSAYADLVRLRADLIMRKPIDLLALLGVMVSAELAPKRPRIAPLDDSQAAG